MSRITIRVPSVALVALRNLGAGIGPRETAEHLLIKSLLIEANERRRRATASSRPMSDRRGDEP